MDNFKGKNAIPQEEFSFAQSVIAKLGDYFSNRVVGQEGLKKSLITAVVADGHILIESVPGLAKTTAAKAISDAVNGKFSRIQCTPDLLPSDIIGTQIYHQETGKFETIFGPVFANFVLLDEVNRSSAKTQSAMLEAMQERQVTIGGITYKMPQDIFIVIATQNPIEQEGTYPLSEAQTDRFMIKEKITYPSADQEIIIMNKIESRYRDGYPLSRTAHRQEDRRLYQDRRKPPRDHQFPQDRQGERADERAHLRGPRGRQEHAPPGAAPQDRPELRGRRRQCLRGNDHR